LQQKRWTKEHDALTGKYSANGIFFTMKHMKTMKKKLQYLHALHGENKKHQLLKNFVFPILKLLCPLGTSKLDVYLLRIPLSNLLPTSFVTQKRTKILLCPFGYKQVGCLFVAHPLN